MRQPGRQSSGMVGALGLGFCALQWRPPRRAHIGAASPAPIGRPRHVRVHTPARSPTSMETDMATSPWACRAKASGTVSNAGGVNIFYGSPSGLTKDNNKFFSQGVVGRVGSASKNAAMGRTLAVVTSTTMAIPTSRSGCRLRPVLGRDNGWRRRDLVRLAARPDRRRPASIGRRNPHGCSPRQSKVRSSVMHCRSCDCRPRRFKDLAIGAPHYPSDAKDGRWLCHGDVWLRPRV